MGTLENWTPLAARLLTIIGAAGVGLLGVEFVTRRLATAVCARLSLSDEREQQIRTIVHLSRWTAHVTIVSMAALTLLSNFVDITPVLTGLGVVGLAVGMGAQTLVKDLIAGLLIVLENQYSVGDVVQIGDLSGTVEVLTLRATYLRDVDGSLHIIPNGEARIVSNRTRQWSRAVVEVGVAYEEDLERVLAVFREVGRDFAADKVYGPQLLGEPQVSGPLSLGDWAVTVRVMVKTAPGEQWRVAGELRRRLLAACQAAGITLPYPRQEVFVVGG